MLTAIRRSWSFLLVLSISSSLSAQAQSSVTKGRPSPVFVGAMSGERLRFTSASTVCQMRVQVVTTDGGLMFDSDWREGNVLEWDIAQEGFGNTPFHCIVSMKDVDGELTREEASLTVRAGEVSIEQSGAPSRLTTVGTEANGPKVTLLAHDEVVGSVVNTSGDLTFRSGNFLGGRDTELMRLTSGGRLGIGTDKPQAPLDVKGLIRTSEGIVFPDGTILTTAGSLSGADRNQPVVREPSARGDGPVVSPRDSQRLLASSMSGFHPTTTPSSVPAPQFVVDSTGVHIGTTAAYGLDVFGNATLSSDLLLPATSGDGLAGVIMMAGAPFAHAFGLNNMFTGANAGNFAMGGSRNTGAGVYALHSTGSGSNNTAVGTSTLVNNTSGFNNTAVGASALASNTNKNNNTAVGNDALTSMQAASDNTAVGASALKSATAGPNTAVGSSALLSDEGGTYNTAVGVQALTSNVSGSSNTAIGDNALRDNANSGNTAVGSSALLANVNGSDNVAVGSGALLLNSGSNNIAIGAGAGNGLTTGGKNIDIGNAGYAGEDHAIHIGADETCAFFCGLGFCYTSCFKTYIAGVRDVITDASDAIPVVISSTGQLGTTSSSRRYKFDINSMGDATRGLMDLRPVTFRYFAHGDNAPLQYGLIAEEVAEVYPEMVTHDKEGLPDGVMYQFLAPMLLNEVQKERRTIDDLQRQLGELQKRLAALERAAPPIASSSR